MQQLGWTDVPVRVVDLAEIVCGEFAENAERKNFLPSAIESIRRAMVPEEKAAAVKRMTPGESFHRVRRWQDSPQDRDVRWSLHSHDGEDRDRLC